MMWRNETDGAFSAVLLIVVGLALAVWCWATIAQNERIAAEYIKELETQNAELAAERDRLLSELWRLDELMEQGNADDVPEPDAAEVEMLACAIYGEAGGDECSDLCRAYVGDVILNRVDNPRFPDTMAEVLTAEGQYGRFHWTGIVWPERADKPGEAAAVARAYDTARALLSGEHSDIYGAGYIWQAEFEQGTDVIHLDGIYFGR